MWTNYMVKWVGVEKLVSRARFYIVRIDFFPLPMFFFLFIQFMGTQ